ncbi:MAG: sigma-54-dependent transcriptional regulator [Hyphomicrobiaceae bacterium]
MPLNAPSSKPSPDHGPLIALIEDDPVMGQSLVDWLRIEGYRTVWWHNGRDALAGLSRHKPDVLLCDIRLPDMTGEDIIHAAASTLQRTPFLFLTAFGDVGQAVRLMQAGAADYLTKPFDVEMLLQRIEGLIAHRWTLTDGWILGRAPKIIEVEQTLRRAASIDTTVLLTGPSGSGKEVAARFLHSNGPRAKLPFLAVNCAAFPRDLLESELFGHEKGAFTGAHQRHEGIAERVGFGTLLLDEIAEIPTELQAKLLRLLEERMFSRVGGGAALHFKARVVAASNADLITRVAQGRFREDLYFRLAVIVVDLPPLRQRVEDIIPLARRFAAEFAEAFGRNIRGIAPTAEEALSQHAFPGNIRELRNRIERAVALTERDWITSADLFPEVQPSFSTDGHRLTLAGARAAAEKRTIENALDEAGGDVEQAADILGVSRSTLFAKIRKLNIRG